MKLIKKLKNKIIKKLDFIVSFKEEKKVQTQYLGSDYGGWNIDSSKLNAESIIYSFGIGDDISFDEACIKMFKCNVFAFDPTSATKEFLKSKEISPNFKFFAYALSNENKIADFYPPSQKHYISHTLEEDIYAPSDRDVKKVHVRTLKSIMNELGHTTIDVLKCDIEGSEYKVLYSVIKEKCDIKQICVEFHHHFTKFSKFKTKKMIQFLKNNRYLLVHIKDDTNFLFLKK